MTRARFDIEKFDETGDFVLWRIKMRAISIQHGCEASLEVLPADMEAQTKAELKKAHNAVILCLGNKVLRKVTGETTAVGVWLKLETLYMTKSLANKLNLKKKLYTFYMPAGRKISEHIDEFTKIVLDLENFKVGRVRLVLEWEERIKLHLEKEMKFNQWRSNNFKNKQPAPVKVQGGTDDEGEETDIQEQDKKKAKNKQSRARNGKDKVKPKPKSVKVRKSTPTKSKVNQLKKIQLEGLKLPNLKLYY
ncbi:hypothetical protein Tco_0396375 [Tanacetum coccineum]